MKKTPKVDKYDPIIYPRKLWVTGEVIGLDKIFVFNKLDSTKVECPTAYGQLVDEYTTSKDGLLTCPVTNRATGEYGALVIIMDHNLEFGSEAHEAVHVADYIFDELGMYSQSFAHHNEQYAYLVGWAAGCISKTLINIKRDYDTRRECNDVEDGARTL